MVWILLIELGHQVSQVILVAVDLLVLWECECNTFIGHEVFKSAADNVP